MVEGKKKSKSKRQVQRRTPGGKTVTFFKERKHSKSICGVCKNQLHGIPTTTKHQLKKLSKTQRRPERPYGGILCSACMRKKITEGIGA